MRVATWNINSVRLRLPLLAKLANEAAPDIICLQETKTPDEAFPSDQIRALGFEHICFRGMKNYNGVAILSRQPFSDTGGEIWCGREDARHVWVRLVDDTEIHNFYVPSGGDEPDPKANDKFAHKLGFMAEMETWWEARRDDSRRRIMVGDFNVAPLENDVWSHKQLLKVVSHTPIEVSHLDRVQASHGWIDALRRFVPEEEKIYSWWSYRARDWLKSDRGRRLDHIWITPALSDRLKSCWVLKDARGWDGPSDHVPVLADFHDH